MYELAHDLLGMACQLPLLVCLGSTQHISTPGSPNKINKIIFLLKNSNNEFLYVLLEYPYRICIHVDNPSVFTGFTFRGCNRTHMLYPRRRLSMCSEAEPAYKGMSICPSVHPSIHLYIPLSPGYLHSNVSVTVSVSICPSIYISSYPLGICTLMLVLQ